jgi:hypothetical protein
MRWLRHWQIVSICIAAALAPFAIVFILSEGPFSGLVVPDLLTSLHRADTSITILADLSQLMITMSVGLALTATWFFRQPLKASAQRFSATMLCIAMLAAFTSIYSGLRFKFDMAMQLQQIPFDFELLKDRFYMQGNALLAQVSLVCVAAVVHHRMQDRRSTKKREG